MEASGLKRPAFVINETHPGSDIAASAAAALAATSRVRIPVPLSTSGFGFPALIHQQSLPILTVGQVLEYHHTCTSNSFAFCTCLKSSLPSISM